MRYRLPLAASAFCLALALAAPSFLVAEASDSTRAPAPGEVSSADSRHTPGEAPPRPSEPDRAAAERVRANYGRLPLSFEANRGQTDARAQFVARNSAYSLRLAADEITLALRGKDARAEKQSGPAGPGASVLRIKLLGASGRARAQGLDELRGKSNYLTGNDPSRWQTNVPHYARVKYESVYPGVDVLYYGTNRELEYDFLVAPGADAGQIRLRVEGAQMIRVDENGDLVLPTAAGEVRQRAPHAYQEIDGARQTIPCRYVLRGANRVGFALGAYDRSLQLVIDPVVSYSTLLGGTAFDDGYAVAVDAQGYAYVTGGTSSLNFPVTPNAPQPNLRATIVDRDAFVTKLTPDGSALVYSTYLGGNFGDRGESIVVDASGQAHVAGETDSTDFPTTPGAFRATKSGWYDVFVAKLSADGSALRYSTYIGGSTREHSPRIALAGGGDVYVAGLTHSTNFPTTPGAFRPQSPGATEQVSDGFVAKLSMSPGAGLLFSTYLGGSGDDRLEGLAIAPGLDGSVYVTGRTASADFPTTPNAWQRTLATNGSGHDYDAFLTRLDPSGAQLVFSTYFGGDGYDFATAVAVDHTGAAYIAGVSGSPGLHVTPGAFQTTFVGGGDPGVEEDAFVAKLSADGAGVLYSTFYGGNHLELPEAIAVDAQGNAYVAGTTGSSDLPGVQGGWQPTFSGGYYDGFFFKLNAAGAAVPYATYLGGSDWERLRGLALDPAGDVYLTGETYSLDFYAKPGSFQTDRRGYTDGFVTKIALGVQDYSVSGRVTNEHGNGLVDVEVGVSGAVVRTARTDAGGNYRVNGLPQGGEVTISASRAGFVFGPQPGVTLSNLSQDETVNFSGPAPLLIRGHVRNGTGSPIGPIPVSVTGSINETRYTDGSGYYFFALPSGGSYTVTPGPDPEHTFAPPSQSVSGLTADQTFDFTGQRGPRLDGRVYDSQYGYGLANMQVTLAGPSLPQPVVQTTDEWGNFSFSSLMRDETYTVTPSDPASHRSFTPPQQIVVASQDLQYVEFAALRPLAIFGWINTSNREAVAGAVAKLVGSTNPAAVTPDIRMETTVDEWGNFTFDDLPRGGDYTVTVTKAGSLYTFEPESRTVSNLQESQVVEFTALPPLRIIGHIAGPDNNGLPATVTLTGTVNATVQADEWGGYEFGDLPRGGNYTVTPSYPNHTFAPASRSVTNIQEDQVVIFEALPPLRIIGQAADANWVGLSGVTVTLTGTVNATVQADEAGVYEFTNLPRGGTYTVTPSRPNYTFAPPSRTVSDIQQDQFFHFEALPPLRIFGGTIDANGVPVAGSTVTLSGAVNATATTDASGYYEFRDLPRGGSYTVTPAHALYNFAPPTREFPSLSADQVAAFEGTLRRFTLRGRAVASWGAPLSGVTVTLGGGANGITQTDANGYYAFGDLPAGRNYTVAAARAGYAFAPETVGVTDPRGDQTANFTGSRLSYTLTGRVTDSAGGAALSGVSVSLAGALSATTQTDAQGNYAFADLPSEGDYTVTPSHPNFNFAPASRPLANLLADAQADFTAARINYQIGGRVADGSGAALAGATVTLSGARSATAQTDSAGNYLFADLPSGFDYAVAVARTHYAFSPAARQVNHLGANTTADFTATLLSHNITGRVVGSNGNGFPGVVVALTGTRNASVTTDAAGNYAFTSLPAGGSYSVEPAREFYDFSPARADFNDLGGDQSANFTAALRRFSIGGRVAEGASGVGGVTVTLSGTQSATAQTDAAGNYLFTQLPASGTYTVTPAHPFFAFSPAGASFNTLPSNQTANFAAARHLYQVSGSVLDPCGRPIAGLTLSLARDGLSLNAQTNAAGFYSFTNVQAGYNYALAPAGSNYTFAPASAAFPALNANQTANFTGTPPVTIVNAAALADAYVRGGSTTTNFGTATQLITRLANQTKDTHETYVKFDAGRPCLVSSVKLRLNGRLSSSGTIPAALYAVPVTAWTETGINWNNKPAPGALLRTTNVVGTTAAWYEWDVTDYVRAEIAAGRSTVSFVLRSTTATNHQATFNSREATGSNAPRLVVTAQ